MEKVFPEMKGGPRARVKADYYEKMEQLIMEVLEEEWVDKNNLGEITNKQIYAGWTSTFTTVKVARESDLDYTRIWARVWNPVMEPKSREIVYLLVHNKLLNQERLFRVGKSRDPYCQECGGGVVEDQVHVFTGCERVGRVWGWFRKIVINLLGEGVKGVSDWDIINLNFPESENEREVCWVVGEYVKKIWKEVMERKRGLMKIERMEGFLRFKYREFQGYEGDKLGQIEGIT